MWEQLKSGLDQGDMRSLARAISLVENEAEGYEILLQSLEPRQVPLLGITGPPGAGKSTLTDALIEQFVAQGKKIGVVCVDPSSAFNYGALLGDRIRMSSWYNHPDVFIRSLASRGALGGLHPHIIEVTDLVKAAGYDVVIIETVGVGQSEVEIASLADITMVVLVPEGGDEVQTMKAGLMEIADIFVVNKADRPGADALVKSLQQMLAPAFSQREQAIPIIKTNAAQKEGIDILYQALENEMHTKQSNRQNLLAVRAYQLIQQKRMKDVKLADLQAKIEEAGSDFNLYQFVAGY